MKLQSSRGIRSLICLVSVLVCASAPLAAQRGIDLLNADEVLRLNSPRVEQAEVTSTVRLVASTDPEFVTGATHDTTTYEFDDGMFENFAEALPGFPPFQTEVAQLFDLDSNGEVVSVTVCFQRPDIDPTRAVVFSLAFYRDDDGEPGNRGGLVYTWESTIRRAGDDRCLTFSGALVGKSLARGEHWASITWHGATNKLLGEDHYTTEDPEPRNNRGDVVHATELRIRVRNLGDPWPEEWENPRAGSQIKAYGIRLVVDHSDHTTTPDPDPDPDPDPGPAADPSCSGGTCVLQDDRFRVRARYSVAGMPGRTAGTTSAALGGSAALFTFGGDSPELLVRVVDECSASGTSGNWAVYAGAASGATYSIAVRDTMTDELKWFSARGGASVADTEAFACSN